MAQKQLLEAQNPLILRCNRLIDAFAKSDDERDFYLDRQEGFIIYVDLDKGDDLPVLEKELEKNSNRYCLIPKLTFYETKKIMEGFIIEKVYDIDTKEKLLDIIQSKEARENFLEFIYDHHSELEKWQTFYQERSRIRIIEWLRSNNFQFVFEEDLEFPKLLLEKLKKELFQTKVGKDIQNARKTLIAKSKTYYSNEALNPRPKRGRPPKQAQKAEIEPQITIDIFTTIPNGIRGFLFNPELNSPASSSFSSKFGNEIDLYANRRSNVSDNDLSMDSLNQKLAALRTISSKWKETDELTITPKTASLFDADDIDFNVDDEDEDEIAPTLNGSSKRLKPAPVKGKAKQKTPPKQISSKTASVKKTVQKAKPLQKAKKPIKIIQDSKSKAKPVAKLKIGKAKAKPKVTPKPAPKAIKAKPKNAPAKKLKTLRPIKKLKKK